MSDSGPRLPPIPPGAPRRLRPSALARLLRVTPAAVYLAITRGRLTRPADGLLDLEQAWREWHLNRKQGAPPPPGSAYGDETYGVRSEPASVSDGAAPAADDDDPRAANMALPLLRREELKLKIAERQQRLAMLQRQLVDRDVVAREVSRLAHAEKEALLQWPARISGELAVELGVDAHKLQHALEERIKDHLRERARVNVELP